MLTATLTGVDEWLAELAADVDAGADAGLTAASELVADEAKAHHAFENRSGDLEASIRALEPSGRLSDDTLRGGVIADEDYGEYVEAHVPFLEPAWDAREQDAADAMEREIDRALNR